MIKTDEQCKALSELLRNVLFCKGDENAPTILYFIYEMEKIGFSNEWHKRDTEVSCIRLAIKGILRSLGHPQDTLISNGKKLCDHLIKDYKKYLMRNKKMIDNMMKLEDHKKLFDKVFLILGQESINMDFLNETIVECYEHNKNQKTVLN